ncbi:MAG: FAD-dependent oxidoreductase [Bacteroidia bacterium]|nr:MAG: FAD-dependent oxidoreductase [Bacteroidia bacterium]
MIIFVLYFYFMKYLIVGAGITGTILAWNLYQNHIPFEIWTAPHIPSVSQIAAGLINPITGKRLAKLSNYENILSVALKTYQEIQNFFSIPLIYQHKIFRFLEDDNLKSHFHQKIKFPEFQNYLNLQPDYAFPTLSFQGDYILIQPAYRINIYLLIETVHQYFKKLGLLFFKKFDEEQDFYHFDKIFLCRGYQEAYSDTFTEQKWENALGEIVIFYAPDLQLNDIYQNQKMTIIPMGNDYYWLGATYLREVDVHNYLMTNELEQFLEKNLKVNYTIVNKRIGIRPILKERKPVFLQSSKNPQYYLINGMGSKGTLWAPYFIQNEVLKALPKIN